MSCPNSNEDCPKIQKEHEKGYVPRGFLFKSRKIKILAVGKNPGNLQNDEAKSYLKKKDRTLFEAHQELMQNLFEKSVSSNKASERFHRNLSEYLAFFLDVAKDEIFTQAAFTNLVKCSSVNEQENLRNLRKAANACFERFFLKELDLFKPKVVLALGGEVYDFLKKQEDELKVHCACLIGIRHPSWPYKKERENDILSKVKEHIEHCILVPDSFYSYGRFS